MQLDHSITRITFVSCRSVFSFIWNAPIITIYTYIQFTIYNMHGWDAISIIIQSCEWLRRGLVYCFALSIFGFLPLHSRHGTYTGFFSSHFFTSDWLAMHEVARNSYFILFTSILNVLHPKLSCGNSFRGKNERISVFLLLYYIKTMRNAKNYANEHDRFKSFQQFRIFCLKIFLLWRRLLAIA